MELKKPKRIKKYTITQLKKKADILFSLKVRSVGRCEAKGLDNVTCGGNLQNCHIVGRSNMRLRFDPMNTLSMCQGHHTHYTFNNWEWPIFIKENFPEKYEYVEAHKNELADRKASDYQALIQELEVQK